MLGDELITLMSEDGAREVCELLWVRVTQLVGGPSRGALTQGRASGQPFCRGPPARPSHACAHSQLPRMGPADFRGGWASWHRSVFEASTRGKVVL